MINISLFGSNYIKKICINKSKPNKIITKIIKEYFRNIWNWKPHRLNRKMNVEEFRKNGKKTIDYICDYSKNIREYAVAPILDPGYLKSLIPGKYR